MTHHQLAKQAEHTDIFRWHHWQCAPEEIAAIGIEEITRTEVDGWCVVFTLRSGREHNWRAKNKAEAKEALKLCWDQWQTHRERLRQENAHTIIRFKP